MRLIILKGRYTIKIFGIQLIYGKYTVQLTFWKLGIYNKDKGLWFEIF